MARQMTPSELQAFSANRPFTDLLSDNEEYFCLYFRLVMSQKLVEPKITVESVDEIMRSKDWPAVDWF